MGDAGFFSIFQIVIGAYLIYAAITGKGKLYENDNLKESISREKYVKKMRLYALVTGIVMLAGAVLEYTGIVSPVSPLGWVIWGAGFLCILVMAVYSAKCTDREAAAKADNRPGRTTVSDAARLKAAFEFDDEEETVPNVEESEAEK